MCIQYVVYIYKKSKLRNDIPWSAEHYIEQRISGYVCGIAKDKCIFFFNWNHNINLNNIL